MPIDADATYCFFLIARVTPLACVHLCRISGIATEVHNAYPSIVTERNQMLRP